MKDLDPLFGPDCINYISADDKARIQLGKDYYINGQNTQLIYFLKTLNWGREKGPLDYTFHNKAK